MTTRIVKVPRAGVCAILSETYRCCLNITCVVEAWSTARGTWSPEIRLCHLHALEYVSGKPAMMPTFGQQELIMLELGA